MISYKNVRDGLGNAGCQPAVAGSRPATRLQSRLPNFQNEERSPAANVLGKLPSTAGWQPALPRFGIL